MNRNIVFFCITVSVAFVSNVNANQNQTTRISNTDTETAQPQSGIAPFPTEKMLGKEDPKIEIKGREIHFSKGVMGTQKTLSYGDWREQRKIVISPNAKSLIKETETTHQLTDKEARLAAPGRNTVNLSYFNVFGEKVWDKEYPVEKSLEDTSEGEPMPYFTKISKNGDAILFVRTHNFPSPDWYADLMVFGTTGTLLASVTRIPALLEGSPSDFELAPDGLLVSAIIPMETKNGLEQHMLFLDVETGQTKIVRIQSNEQDNEWGVSSDLLSKKHIKFTGNWGEEIRSQKVSFSNLPADISKINPFKKATKK